MKLLQDRDRRDQEREPAQSKSTCPYHKRYFMREFTGKVLRPKIATQSLREPAQSKCTGTCDKSRFMRHLMREFTRKMPGPKIKKKSPRRLCTSLHSRNAYGHVTRLRAILCEYLQKNAGAQDRDAKFARAFAILMHMDM